MTEKETNKKDRFRFRVWNNVLKCYSTDNHCINEDGELNTDGDYVVEQCTGLIAKNGKLIYEGDILSDGDDFGYVFFNKSNGCLAVNNFLWQNKPEDLLVVGNVHENYELIGGVE